MTIHTGVSLDEAEKLVAEGGRVLQRYFNEDREAVCDVETNGGSDSGQPPPPPPPQAAEEAPKKRGRPKKTASEG